MAASIPASADREPFKAGAIAALGNLHLGHLVGVDIYDFAPCYLWYDRPLYNDFGEAVRYLKGDTIYLYQDSMTPIRDLFHELGHVVGRTCNLVGNTGNGFQGDWEQDNIKMIAEITGQRHWSSYLNLYSLSRADFKTNAASEIWAELFMLWYLNPESDEANLLDEPMRALQGQPIYEAIWKLASDLDIARTQALDSCAPA